MAERKVINKYYSPEFDPSLVPRRKKAKLKQVQVRMMMPMSVTCVSCGEYIYRGKKFNSRKETAAENYLGIPIYRFYMRCPRCSAEFTIKTDPKNADYVAEAGCSRQQEPWKEEENSRASLIAQRLNEEGADAMKALENKTMDSKMEMEILDALEEIKALNARNAVLGDGETAEDAVLRMRREKEQQLEQNEEQYIEDVFGSNIKRVAAPEEEEHVLREATAEVEDFASRLQRAQQAKQSKKRERVRVQVKRESGGATAEQNEKKRPGAALPVVAVVQKKQPEFKVPMLPGGSGGGGGSAVQPKREKKKGSAALNLLSGYCKQ